MDSEIRRHLIRLSGLVAERTALLAPVQERIDAEIRALAETEKRILAEKPIVYANYIASPEWREKAEAAKIRAGHKCQLCGEDKLPLVAHHNTYERLGEERDEDIFVLCVGCNHKFHAPDERGRPTRMPMRRKV